MDKAPEAGSALARLAGQIFSGASSALLPLATQAVAGTTLTLSDQGLLAVALSAGAFAAAIVGSLVVESRLALQDPRSRETYVPLSITVLGVLGTLLLAAGALAPWAVIIGVPLVMICLSVGRLHAIVEDRLGAELVAGAAITSTSLVAMSASSTLDDYSFVLLACGSLAAIIVRSIGSSKRPAGSAPAAHQYLLIATETSVTAVVPLALNVLVLTMLGPGDAVAFRLIISVLGILQPILGLLRTRLLARPSRRLALLLSLTSAGVLGALILADAAQLLDLLIGTAWNTVSPIMLALACLWKLCSIPATVPFAALRRLGALRAVLLVRLMTSGIFLLCGLAALALFDSLPALFASLAIAEVAATAMYYLAYSRNKRP